MIGWILLYIVIGLIVGVLVRMVMPGRQNLSLVATIIIGALGALIGGALTRDVLHVQNKHGIPWIALFVSVIVGCVLVAIYGSITGRGTRA